MIERVTPTQDVFKNWQRYRHYVHTMLNKTTNDPEIHEELDGNLFFWIKRITELYDPKKGELHPYAKRAFQRRVQRFVDYTIKDRKKCFPVEDFPTIQDETVNLDTDIETYMYERQLLKYLASIPKRESLILKLYYGIQGFKEHTTMEIAKLLDISFQRVNQIRVRALERLKKYFQLHNINSMEDMI